MNSPEQPNRPRNLRNWLSLAGGIIAGGGLFAFVLLFGIDLLAHRSNPYMGILAYVVAPGFMLLGLSLVVAGAWLQWRHRRTVYPPGKRDVLTIDVSRARDRKLLIGFFAGAIVFLMVTAFGSYQTYHLTESTMFCGQACHTPMKPEFTAYLNSPHARVACTECHIGSGATAYLKAKINGVHQLFSMVANDYPRPIPTPVENLRPAQETCEQCHWPQKFGGNRDRTYSHYLMDETNTPFAVRLLLKVGGGDPAHGPVGGIHWHVSPGAKVEYISTDHQRQIIPWVRLTDSLGVVTEYRTKDFKGDPARFNIRRMDCLDCHNRPAHHFRPPNDAVDLAIDLGKIDRSLPWIKSNVVAALTASYPNEAEALQKISGSLSSQYPNEPRIQSAIQTVQDIYQKNFFPEMKASWRVYPDNIGHKNWAGCFRCHDGEHKTIDGKKTISASDCTSCHTIIAQGDSEQMKQISAKGLPFFHLDAVNEEPSCNNCHTGAFQKD